MSILQMVTVDHSLLWEPSVSLRRPSEEVACFDERLEALVRDMRDTLLATDKGVALAAPQVGLQLRLFVAHLERLNQDHPEDPLTEDVFVNPVIISTSKNADGRETCLSVPGYFAPVRRATRVTVEAQDARGRRFTVETRGFTARAMLHEIDHLDGILYVDRLKSPDELESKSDAENAADPTE